MLIFVMCEAFYDHKNWCSLWQQLLAEYFRYSVRTKLTCSTIVVFFFLSMKTLKRYLYVHLRVMKYILARISCFKIYYLRIVQICLSSFFLIISFCFLLLFCFNFTVMFVKLTFWKQCEGPVWILRALKWEQLLSVKWHSSNSGCVSVLAASSLLSCICLIQKWKYLDNLCRSFAHFHL